MTGVQTCALTISWATIGNAEIGSSMDDHAREETCQMRGAGPDAADPLLRAREHLLARGVDAVRIDALDRAAADEIAAAVAFADASPAPALEQAYTDVQTIGEGAWQ